MANRPTLNIHEQILWAFATPIVAFQWPDSQVVNAELQTLILDRERRHRSRRFSNAGGWQSSDDLLAWGAPATKELKRRIDQLLHAVIRATSVDAEDSPQTRFRLDCWANVSRHGDYNVVHSHPNALWSGVYYVASGKTSPDESQAGKIELLDPREAAGFLQVNHTIMSQKCFLKNDPGLMLMFPSWLKHMVHPHKGPDPRISIAFNAMPVLS